MSKLKALIFDAFDTLLTDGCRESGDRLAKEKGLSNWNELRLQLPSWMEHWEKFWLGEIDEEGMTRRITLDLNRGTIKRFFNNWERFTKADKKMVDLLGELRKKKDLKLGMLANAPSKLVVPLKKEIPLNFFDVVLVSCEEGMMKPDQRIFELMAKKLEVKKEECLFIDDSQMDVQAAKKIGMKAIQFKGYQDIRKELTAREVI